MRQIAQCTSAHLERDDTLHHDNLDVGTHAIGGYEELLGCGNIASS
jgi:hypothetical protein